MQEGGQWEVAFTRQFAPELELGRHDLPGAGGRTPRRGPRPGLLLGRAAPGPQPARGARLPAVAHRAGAVGPLRGGPRQHPAAGRRVGDAGVPGDGDARAGHLHRPAAPRVRVHAAPAAGGPLPLRPTQPGPGGRPGRHGRPPTRRSRRSSATSSASSRSTADGRRPRHRARAPPPHDAAGASGAVAGPGVRVALAVRLPGVHRLPGGGVAVLLVHRLQRGVVAEVHRPAQLRRPVARPAVRHVALQHAVPRRDRHPAGPVPEPGHRHAAQHQGSPSRAPSGRSTSCPAWCRPWPWPCCGAGS
jgi:hypothetical protein